MTDLADVLGWTIADLVTGIGLFHLLSAIGGNLRRWELRHFARLKEWSGT